MNGEQVAHLAESTEGNIAASGRNAALKAHRRDRARPTARIEHGALKGFNVQPQLHHPARLEVETLLMRGYAAQTVAASLPNVAILAGQTLAHDTQRVIGAGAGGTCISR
jgi:hypothetical protein